MNRVLKVCTYRNCGRVGCTEHARLRQQHADAARADRAKRDGRNLAAWRRLRKTILLRDGHECQLHLDSQCTLVATTVHKITRGYHTTDLDQYTSACRHCHGVVDGKGGSRRAQRPNAPAPTAPANCTVSGVPEGADARA